MDYAWLLYLLLGFIAGIIGASIVWYSRVWGVLHIDKNGEKWRYTIEFTGRFEEVSQNKYVVLRTSHK